MFVVSQKKYPEVSDYFEAIYQRWIQSQPRSNHSVQKFSEYLGFDRQVVSHWVNGHSRPSVENARRIAEATGDQGIFVLIDAGATDPLLQYIITRWDKLTPDEIQKISELFGEAGAGRNAVENLRKSSHG